MNSSTELVVSRQVEWSVFFFLIGRKSNCIDEKKTLQSCIKRVAFMDQTQAGISALNLT